MGDAVWMLVGALALVCAVLGGLLWHKRSRRPAARPDAAPVAPVDRTGPAPTNASPAVETPRATLPDPATALVPPAGPAAPVAAAKPVARAEPPTELGTPAQQPVVTPTTKPPAVAPVAKAPAVVPTPIVPIVERALRFELHDDQAEPALRLERCSAAAWQGATPLEATPMQRDALARLLACADQLEVAPGAAGEPLYRLQLRHGAALALARGKLGGASGPELRSAPPEALDPALASQAAAVTLALHCAPVYLVGLRAHVTETKTVAASLHPKLVAQHEGRLKSLLQDLTRYLREAEENYAGAVRKPVFVARVAETCGHAETLWQSVGEAVATARAQLDTQAKASRFGEVQLERSLAALRDLQSQRRAQDSAARILAGWQALRLALGEAAPAAAAALRDAAAALRSSDAADRALGDVLKGCIDGAKVPDYVGKAEFIANRSAARELLQRIDAESLEPAGQQLTRAAEAIEAGYAGEAALELLLRLDSAGQPAELRRP